LPIDDLSDKTSDFNSVLEFFDLPISLDIDRKRNTQVKNPANSSTMAPPPMPSIAVKIASPDKSSGYENATAPMGQEDESIKGSGFDNKSLNQENSAVKAASTFFSILSPIDDLSDKTSDFNSVFDFFDLPVSLDIDRKRNTQVTNPTNSSMMAPPPSLPSKISKLEVDTKQCDNTVSDRKLTHTNISQEPIKGADKDKLQYEELPYNTLIQRKVPNLQLNNLEVIIV
jgi:hypothetical protein